MNKLKNICCLIIFLILIVYPMKVEALSTIKELSVDGATLSPEFSKDNFVYDIIINEEKIDTKINYKLDDSEAIITNAGKVTLTNGKEHNIVVIDEVGNLSIYNLIPRKVIKPLKTIEFENIEFDFKEGVLDYTLAVPFWVTSLDVKNIDKNYTYTFNDSFLRVGKNDVIMTVSKDGIPDIIYTFHITRAELNSYTTEFNYTGSGYETFTVPKDGKYKIELWGAQGGNYSGLYGGKGAYTSGEINLKANEKLYFYIGGTTTTRNGGYNGGAAGGTIATDGNSRGGGGATDVRLKDGNWNDFESLKSRIMVAAAGGGAVFYQSKYPLGGAGGGLTGYGAALSGKAHTLATGATQTSGGVRGGESSCSLGSSGTFGAGGAAGTSGVNATSSRYGSGGGSGYYGGGGGGCIGSGVSSGSSGSSYISGHTGSNSISALSTSTNIIHTGSANHYSGYVFANTKMVDGLGKNWTTTAGAVTNMPTWNGTSTMTGNSGNGYAKITLMDYAEPKLKSLDIIGGYLEETFDPDVFDYTMYLSDEETELEVLGLAEHYDLKVEGNGKYIIQPGESTIEIKVSNANNESNTYTITIERDYSSAPILKGILVNGYEIPNFDPEVLEYTVEVEDVFPVAVVEGITLYPKQEVTGGGVKALDGIDKLDVDLMVFSEDRELDYKYTVHIIKKETTKLKSLILENNPDMLEFQSNVTYYELKLLPNVLNLDIEAIPAAIDADVEIIGNTYIAPTKDSIITINVTKDGLTPTTYEIKIIRDNDLSGYDYNYPYDSTKAYYEFIAPVSGFYNIEAWGAQGGSFSGLYGGQGAYTKGEINLAQGEKLYIYVGSTTETRNAGYNSGANGGTTTSDGVERGGGGATDIRLANGNWNDFNSLKTRIMVAAGGGGSIFYQNVYVKGGAGGGLNGYGGALKGVNHTLPVGATQTAGGNPGGLTNCSQGARGGFGYGGSGGVIRTVGGPTYGGGGGGGYYGGSGGGCIGGGVSSGSSGSSFISGHYGSNAIVESSSASNIAFTNQEIHYSGKKFINTVMIDGNGYGWTNVKGSQTMMPDKSDSYYSLGTGNIGDGLARIGLVSLLSSDNYLDEIAVSKGTLSPVFEPGIFEYDLELGEKDAKLEIGAIAKDPNATITGTGVFDIKPGFQDYTLTVTATDGSIRNYVIHVHRQGSSDATPVNIKLNKLSTYLCKKNPLYCQYKFEPNTLEYEVVIPFTTDLIELKATAKSIYQNIEYFKYEDGDYTETENGLYNLESGENKFKIVVTAEDGVTKNEYLYTIIRDDTGNANLKSLTIENPNIEVGFAKGVYEYYLNIDSSYTKYDVIAVPESPDAKVTSIVGNDNLVVGINDCFITVTAPDGVTTKTYAIHMYKERDTNVFLRKLDVKDKNGNLLEINPVFNKILNNYSITVPNNINEIFIDAQAESNDATVTGNGNVNLVAGVNTLKIKVESGENTNEYELVVNRSKNNNALLDNIIVDNFDLMPDFESEVTEYYLVIDKDATELNVTAVPQESTTTYTVKGNIITSENQDIVITSIAEDKSYKIYTIHVSREVDSDNTLKSIELPEGITLNEEFDPLKNNYTITVPESIDKIDIKGIATSSKARVNGNGVYSLITGENTIEIVVTNEKGEDNTYIIKVNKLKSNDSSLKEILNNRGSVVVKESDTTYIINVQYEVNTIEITAKANSAKTTVTGNGNYNLNVGDNVINIRVTAEDNTYTDYKVKVVRDKSQNDDLAFLYVHEGGLQPNFKETTIVYDIFVPNEITNLNELHIEAIPEDKNAKVEILNNDGALEVGVAKSFVVRVTAEDGINTKDYTINVTRQNTTEENLALLKLDTNRGDVVPTFNADILNYTLEVENEITDITVTGTALSDNVTVEGNGTKALKVGKNLISIFVIGTDGVEKDYQVVVNRKKSSDATLENLVVKEHALNPGFNKNTFDYSFTISGTVLEFITIKPTEAEATYKIGLLNNNTFEALPEIGFNKVDISSFSTTEKVVIRVTAPDEVTYKDYNLTITKEPSKNNNLSFLEVEGYSIIPNFHKGVNVYTLDVPNEVKNIIINATPEDAGATVTGTGVKTVNVGSNTFEVIVESEARTTKKYTIIVSKNGSDNNNLASLIVSEGTLSPTFSPSTQEYSVTVANDVTSININGTLEDSNAYTNDFGTYPLEVGRNEINITVTSEDGSIKVYKILVNRNDSITANLKSLEIDNYDLDTEFNPELTEYYIDVNNEINSLDKLNITAIPYDSEATVNITSSKDTFDIGINEVKILVTAKDNATTKEYTLYVNRNLSSNNYLKQIDLSEGTLNPEFDPKTLEYEIHVPNSVTSINIDAQVEDSSSTIVSGLGDHNLLVGNNKIQIKVKSSLGIYRTYILNVIREGSDDNYLTSLVVKRNSDILNFNEPFDKENNNYTITVPSDVLFVNINATASNNLATITGIGNKQLVKGENTFEVVVTSESGKINVYRIVITKEASSNNNVTNIIPSSGTFTKDFDPDIKEYILNLDNDVVSIGFEVTVEDPTAIVKGNGNELITDNNITRNIIIEAENGTENRYVIHIVRASDAEARLESLTIDNYPFDFDSDTFTYNIAVSKQKKKLLESEITAIAKDTEATVNMMGDLDLTDGIINIYTIEVIAKDGYTAQTYTLNVTRDSEEYTIRTNKYEIVRFEDETNEDYVIGIQPSTLISDFKSNFENEPEDLKVYLDTNEVQETDLTATAFVLKLEKNGYVYDTLRVIVRGDLTKDGKVNITDQVKMINYVGRTTTFDKYQMLAGDLTFDGKVNITDQVKIINYVGRTISDLNNKPTS